MLRKWIAAGLLLARAGVSLAHDLETLRPHEKTLCCSERMCPRPQATSTAPVQGHCHDSAPSPDPKLKCNCQGEKEAAQVVSGRPYVLESPVLGAPALLSATLPLPAVEHLRNGFGRLDSPPPRTL